VIQTKDMYTKERIGSVTKSYMLYGGEI
jgi:hypothetical protein